MNNIADLFKNTCQIRPPQENTCQVGSPQKHLSDRTTTKIPAKLNHHKNMYQTGPPKENFERFLW